MATPTAPRKAPLDPVQALALAILFDDLQQHQPVADGHLAEQRHCLDADADTVVPTPGIAHPKPVPSATEVTTS